MAGTKTEAPFAMSFAVKPPITETARQAIIKAGGRYDSNSQSWKFAGDKTMRETPLGRSGTNIKGSNADDKAGKDE